MLYEVITRRIKRSTLLAFGFGLVSLLGIETVTHLALSAGIFDTGWPSTIRAEPTLAPMMRCDA